MDPERRDKNFVLEMSLEGELDRAEDKRSREINCPGENSQGGDTGQVFYRKTQRFIAIAVSKYRIMQRPKVDTPKWENLVRLDIPL